MKEHVTVIPDDNMIRVDGMALPCEFESSVNGLHALQWHSGRGELEIVRHGKISNVAIENYEQDVLPYVTIWQAKYDAINMPRVLTLDELRDSRLAELKVAFETASDKAHCLSSAGFEINADELANRNIASLIIAMEASGQESVLFCAFDNRFHEVTLAQLKAMQLDIIANGQAIYARKWQLREQINGASTRDELNAIVIDFDKGVA